jgi:prepilin-type N-terminal cleavage/methylation domain-containing protein
MSKAKNQQIFTRGFNRRKSSAAFTLVELLVSVAIFTLITTAAVFNNAQFNGNVILTNLAYEVALSVRQAQFYGITVKQSSTNTFDAGYGIHFDTATPAAYLLFEDKPTPDKTYSAGEALETYTLRKGNTISKICVSNVSRTCLSPGSTADISFIRPNPDAYIRYQGTLYSQAEICVSSPLGNKRKVVVESTGQISVATDSEGTCN